MSHSEQLIHAWLLVRNTRACHALDWQWLDLDPMSWLPITPGGWDNYPSTEVGLRARQGLLLRQHRAHRVARGRGRAATARQQERKQQQRQEQANDDDSDDNDDDDNDDGSSDTDDDQELNPLLVKALRRMQEHTPRIELRLHAADGRGYFHVHGEVGLPLVLPVAQLDPIDNPRQPRELLIPLDQATSVRLQELSYEYTLEVAATRSKKNAATCPICLDDLGTKVRVLTCKHRFHPACIDSWCLHQENDNKTCPYCRQVLWE